MPVPHAARKTFGCVADETTKDTIRLGMIALKNRKASAFEIHTGSKSCVQTRFWDLTEFA